MKTLTALKPLKDNPIYAAQRKEHLRRLERAAIEAPLIEIVQAFNKLPYAYTLQSCYGHFMHGGQHDPHNLDPLPAVPASLHVEYRIAYIAFCIENSDAGKRLLRDLNALTDIDPHNIQLCCAKWFWQRQVNSYVLQVEPDWCKFEDKARLTYEQALSIERLRHVFFSRLMACLQMIPC